MNVSFNAGGISGWKAPCSFRGKRGRTQQANEKGDDFSGENVKTVFSVRKRYMMAALRRNRNMIQEEMAVWIHAEMKS